MNVRVVERAAWDVRDRKSIAAGGLGRDELFGKLVESKSAQLGLGPTVVGPSVPIRAWASRPIGGYVPWESIENRSW